MATDRGRSTRRRGYPAKTRAGRCGSAGKVCAGRHRAKENGRLGTLTVQPRQANRVGVPGGASNLEAAVKRRVADLSSRVATRRTLLVPARKTLDHVAVVGTEIDPSFADRHRGSPPQDKPPLTKGPPDAAARGCAAGPGKP